MVYVVLTQNEFGLRDAWYVNGDNLEEALQEACAVMANVGIADPEAFTILPSVENRAVPYMFPKDPETDAGLILDFLCGYVRPVHMDYASFCNLAEDADTRMEQSRVDARVSMEAEAKILQFAQMDNGEE